MRRTWIRLISLLVITLLTVSGVVLAAGETTAEVVFSATEKENDIVELDVIVKNAKFMVFQTALKYNKEVVVPVNIEGEPTVNFDGFATKTEVGKLLNTAGAMLDPEEGVFGFAYFIMPGTVNEKISDKAELIAGDDGESITKFRFKKIADGDCGFAVVTSKETDFAAATESGVSIMDFDSDGDLPVKISYKFEGEKTGEETVEPPEVDVPDSKDKEEEPVFTDEDRKKDVICLQIGKNLTVTYGKKKAIDEDNNLVVPYIKNDRTLVPLRYIAETLGAEVLWEEGWDGCIIKKDGTEIEITFGSAEFTVNGKTVTYEAPIEVVHDRTMVPVRFISENLGCNVYWNELNQAVVISPLDNPWEEERSAEKIALVEMIATLLPMMQ